MCGKMAPAQNPFGSILNPSALKGPDADPLGVCTNTQKSKQALFKIDKATWVEKGLRPGTFLVPNKTELM